MTTSYAAFKAIEKALAPIFAELDAKVFDDDVVSKYCSIKSSAKSRGIEFNLSLTSVRNLLKSKKCYYTGETFGQHVKKSFDRKNPSKGYVKGNVVACSEKFNLFKERIEHMDSKASARLIKNLQMVHKTVHKGD